MYPELNSRIDKMKEKIVETAQEIVSIKSIEDSPAEGRPFGEGVGIALETFLATAEQMGLKTKNLDGYAGHVEIGEGGKIIALLCHLDVVPEGKGWTYPPYGAEIHNNRLYGRGSIDDKGPAVAALYALKAINEEGIPLNNRIRLILGTDEESGWEGLNYYLQHEENPDIGFSPDAEYPVIHGEKGITIFKLKKEFKASEEINITITGGNAPNMVPDYCEANIKIGENKIVELNELIANKGYKIELEYNGEELLIKSHGISAHGSLPADGFNAISQLMVFLNETKLVTGGIEDFIKFYNEKIGMEYNGQSIGCGLEDDLSGKLIFNVGMIKLDSNQVDITVNIRYPITIKNDRVIAGIKKALEGSGVSYIETEHKEPIYVPKEDPLVSRLMSVYRDFTGDDSEPITIGGGTYARAIERAVAFGPLFPGQKELAHQKDEYIGVEDLILNTKIYAAAIVELDRGEI